MATIGVQTMKKILKGEGATRVSNDASVLMLKIVNAIARDIAKRAIESVKYTNKKTIREEDIAFVSKNLLMDTTLKDILLG